MKSRSVIPFPGQQDKSPDIKRIQVDFQPSGSGFRGGRPSERESLSPDESAKWLESERDSAESERVDPERAGRNERPLPATSKPYVVSARMRNLHWSMEGPWPVTLDELVKRALVRSLRETQGNRRRSASLLGISRSTLYRMLERYGIGEIGRKLPRHPHT